MSTLLRWLSCFVLAAVIVSYLTPYDDTDPPDGRSGIKLYTDHRTGCQYLSFGVFGGTLQRFDANGTHICETAP